MSTAAKPVGVGAGESEEHSVPWLKLTQANTGVAIHVNMSMIVVVAPNKTGGSALLTTVPEREAGRILPVKESPQEIADLLQKAGASL